MSLARSSSSSSSFYLLSCDDCSCESEANIFISNDRRALPARSKLLGACRLIMSEAECIRPGETITERPQKMRTAENEVEKLTEILFNMPIIRSSTQPSNTI